MKDTQTGGLLIGSGIRPHNRPPLSPRPSDLRLFPSTYLMFAFSSTNPTQPTHPTNRPTYGIIFCIILLCTFGQPLKLSGGATGDPNRSPRRRNQPTTSQPNPTSLDCPPLPSDPHSTAQGPLVLQLPTPLTAAAESIACQRTTNKEQHRFSRRCRKGLHEPLPRRHRQPNQRKEKKSRQSCFGRLTLTATTATTTVTTTSRATADRHTIHLWQRERERECAGEKRCIRADRHKGQAEVGVI